MFIILLLLYEMENILVCVRVDKAIILYRVVLCGICKWCGFVCVERVEV